METVILAPKFSHNRDTGVPIGSGTGVKVVWDFVHTTGACGYNRHMLRILVDV